MTIKLTVTKLRWNPRNPGFTTWTNLNSVKYVVMEYRAIGWQYFEIEVVGE
jgi:hypothetical protein